MRKGSLSAKILLLGLTTVVAASILTGCSAAKVEVAQSESLLRIFTVNVVEGTPLPYVKLKLRLASLTLEGVANGSGYLEYKVGNVTDPSQLAVREITVYGSYILTMIQRLHIENVRHSAVYVERETRYRDLDVDPEVIEEGNRTVYRFTLAFAKAKPVNVSDVDPFSDYMNPRKADLRVEPSVPVEGLKPGDPVYESLYLIPVDYPIRLFLARFTRRTLYRGYTTTVVVGEEDNIVNWMKIYTFDLMEEWISRTLDKVDWYSQMGLNLYEEKREAEHIESYLDYLGKLFDQRAYREAMYTIGILRGKVEDLEARLANQDVTVALSVFLSLAFSYGFSYFLAFLSVREEKLRFPIQVIFFFASTLLFFYTLPELRVGFVVFSSHLLAVRIPYLDPATTFLSCFSAGTVAFLSLSGLSYLLSSKMELHVNLGMRNLRSRIRRTLLMAATIAIVVGASISFVRVATVHAITETESYTVKPKTGGRSITLYAEPVEKKFLTRDTLVWLSSQEWARNITYYRMTPDYIFERGASCEAELAYGETGSWRLMKLYVVDPEVFAKLYKLDRYVIGGGYLSSNESSVLIPSTLGVPVGATVQVNTLVWFGPDPTRIPVGRFKVKGVFNPGALEEVRGLDGKPLFENPSYVIITSALNLQDKISGMTILYIPSIYVELEDQVDPEELAKQMVHLFGCKAAAYSDGSISVYEEVYILQAVGWTGLAVPIAIICLLTYLTMFSAIYERRRELRILAVLGASPRVVTSILVTEGLMLGLFSSFLGYFGTYLVYLILDYIPSILSAFSSLLGYSLPEVPGLIDLESIPWGFQAVTLSILVGTAIPLSASYIPAFRARVFALVGRESRRTVERDVRVVGEKAEFPLPIRTTMFEGDLLYAYFEELFSRRFKSAKASGQLFQDGTFEFRFAVPSETQMAIDCKLVGLRRDETIYPTITFPAAFRKSRNLQNLLYKLEKLSLEYTTWKEAKLKVRIIRTAPRKKEKTAEEILEEVRLIQDEIKVLREKLETLESIRPRISTPTYEEYRARYSSQIEELMRKLRPLALELEPYYNTLLEEARQINLELEKLEVARKLGELSDEEYQEKASPVKIRLSEVNRRISDLNALFTELKLPRGVSLPRRTRSSE